MQEVFRHWDTATVGLVNSLLEDAGIKTILRNWDGCNITEIPIPAIYPNVCVMHEEDLARARELISVIGINRKRLDPVANPWMPPLMNAGIAEETGK